jgi:hypothetical protein
MKKVEHGDPNISAFCAGRFMEEDIQEHWCSESPLPAEQLFLQHTWKGHVVPESFSTVLSLTSMVRKVSYLMEKNVFALQKPSL